MRIGIILVVIAVSTAFAAPYKLQAVGDDAKVWRGKTVVLTARPRARFVSWSAGKMALGLLGGGVAAAAGKQIVEQNGIENSAPKLANALFEATQAHYGVIAAELAPLALDSTDVAAVARAGRGADLVFDVQPMRSSLEPLLTQTGRYFVTSDVMFRDIDVASARVLGEAPCGRTTQLDSNLPTKDELLANRAARLKATLDAQRDFCLEFFKMQVLGLPATELH